MSVGPNVSVQCLSFREYFSASNMKSMLRGFVYEYETPKIVTIHSVSSRSNIILISLQLLFIYNNKIKNMLYFLFPSCPYVSSYSITYFNLWYCIFNDPQKRLSRNRYINYFIDYIES